MATWDQRVKASLEAGKKPAYSDYEEGLEYTLKELNMTRAVLQEISGHLSQIVIARMRGDIFDALAVIDRLIAENVFAEDDATAEAG